MRLRVVVMLLLTQVLGTSVCLSAQDKRKVTEPKFPQTCALYVAPLSSTPLDGPVIGQTASEQNAESNAETATLKSKLNECGSGQAVELILGADNSRNAFLLNPINLPLGVSLIIDAGVTVMARGTPAITRIRRPQQFSAATTAQWPPTRWVRAVCHCSH